MFVSTLAQLKLTKPSDGASLRVLATNSEYTFRENRPDLVADDDAILASTVPGRENDRWERETATSSGGGGGGSFASQAEAEAGTDTTKYMNPLRTAQAIAALGGGGGSAYPDSATAFAVDGSLTELNQGLVFVTGLGVTLTLPDDPAPGTTYKFVSVTGFFSINTGAGSILTLGSGTIKIGIYRFTLVYGGSGSWLVVDAATDLAVYAADAVYPRGAKVIGDGTDVYISLDELNVGNALTVTNKWRKVPRFYDNLLTDVTGSVSLDVARDAGNETLMAVIATVNTGSGNGTVLVSIDGAGGYPARIEGPASDSVTTTLTFFVPAGSTYTLQVDNGTPALVAVWEQLLG